MLEVVKERIAKCTGATPEGYLQCKEGLTSSHQLSVAGHIYTLKQLVWYLAHGTIPEDRIYSSCNDPRCLRIEHMYISGKLGEEV